MIYGVEFTKQQCINTRSSADADKPTRLTQEVSQGHQSQYHSMLGIFPLVPLSLRCVVFQYSTSKNAVTLVRGHSRSLKVVPFYRLGVVSYQCSIETLSVKRTVFEIFNFKNAVTLKTGLGSVKVIGNVTMQQSTYNFLLTFYNNYASISCHF